MSQGKPILAMINGDGAKLVEESKCGFSVNAGDSKIFTEAVRKMSEMDKSELTVLGQNGKNFYETTFTKEQRIEQLNKLLTEPIQ